MRIAIIGTRGIPNHYGGFEQCAEYLAAGLVKKGYEVVVYNSHNHPYQEKEYKSVEICHCYDPEFKLGTIGQFIYDLNCIKDVRKKDFDVILQLGYTSSSVWGWLLPRRNTVVTTNMDGLEWKRTKYSKPVKAFLRVAEKLAVAYSDFLIADSTEIQRYIDDKYGRRPSYIPYGAEIFETPDAAVLNEYGVEPYQYDMLIARMEPENSIEVILDGVAKAGLNRKFLVVGNTQNVFGAHLKSKFQNNSNIKFCEAIFDLDKLNNLRYHSNLYFHGHTVGGTNPSLLEAMASNGLICANKNIFNEAVLGDDALYFSDAADVANCLQAATKISGSYAAFLSNNLDKIRTTFSCDSIINAYASHFEYIVREKAEAKQAKAPATNISLVLENS